MENNIIQEINEPKKRYWLRGGIILGVIYTVLIILGSLISWITISKSSFSGGNIIILSFMSKILFPGSWVTSIFLSMIISVIFYILLGAGIGWVYGKIKNRNINKVVQQ